MNESFNSWLTHLFDWDTHPWGIESCNWRNSGWLMKRWTSVFLDSNEEPAFLYSLVFAGGTKSDGIATFDYGL